MTADKVKCVFWGLIIVFVWASLIFLSNFKQMRASQYHRNIHRPLAGKIYQISKNKGEIPLKGAIINDLDALDHLIGNHCVEIYVYDSKWLLYGKDMGICSGNLFPGSMEFEKFLGIANQEVEYRGILGEINKGNKIMIGNKR